MDKQFLGFLNLADLREQIYSGLCIKSIKGNTVTIGTNLKYAECDIIESSNYNCFPKRRKITVKSLNIETK